MKFLDRETCEALVKIGCKTNHRFVWDASDHVRVGPEYGDNSPPFLIFAMEEEERFGPFVPAFTLSDFLEGEQGDCNSILLVLAPLKRGLTQSKIETKVALLKIKMIRGDWRSIVREAVNK